MDVGWSRRWPGNGVRGRRRCCAAARNPGQVRRDRRGGVRARVHRSTIPARGRAVGASRGAGVAAGGGRAGGSRRSDAPRARHGAGGIAQREVSRARHRTLAAMRAQAFEQGRFLGGRPPYGYRLVDAGPHPNRAQAAWGKRLQRLDPEPVTAAHVRWMFARRLAGRSLAGIARELNERGVLCPSLGDPERNRNRLGGMWSVPTVGAILANPRYTGREVWNRRQATDRTGRSTVVGECVVSKAVTHPALVSEADFVAAQRVRAERAIGDGGRRRYLLRGLLRCGHCGRRMDSHWVHERPGTAAATATAAPRRDPWTRRTTSTSARTRCSADSPYASRSTTVTRRGPRHRRTPSISCAQTLWWWRSTARPDGRHHSQLMALPRLSPRLPRSWDAVGQFCVRGITPRPYSGAEHLKKLARLRFRHSEHLPRKDSRRVQPAVTGPGW